MIFPFLFKNRFLSILIVAGVLCPSVGLQGALLNPLDYEPHPWPNGTEGIYIVVDPDAPTMTAYRHYDDEDILWQVAGVWQPQDQGPNIAVFCFDQVDCRAFEIDILNSDHPVAILSHSNLLLLGNQYGVGYLDLGFGNDGTGKGGDGYKGVWISLNIFQGRFGPDYRASGGGGGGFAGGGGKGGTNWPLPVASGGGTYGDPTASLQCGSEGGVGGKNSWWGLWDAQVIHAQGGKGGGAMELGAVGRVEMNMKMNADGQFPMDGLLPIINQNEIMVGGGGGSGGMVRLHGERVKIGSGGEISVNGGEGGFSIFNIAFVSPIETSCGGGGGGGWIYIKNLETDTSPVVLFENPLPEAPPVLTTNGGPGGNIIGFSWNSDLKGKDGKAGQIIIDGKTWGWKYIVAPGQSISADDTTIRKHDPWEGNPSAWYPGKINATQSGRLNGDIDVLAGSSFYLRMPPLEQVYSPEQPKIINPLPDSAVITLADNARFGIVHPAWEGAGNHISIDQTLERINGKGRLRIGIRATLRIHDCDDLALSEISLQGGGRLVLMEQTTFNCPVTGEGTISPIDLGDDVTSLIIEGNVGRCLTFDAGVVRVEGTLDGNQYDSVWHKFHGLELAESTVINKILGPNMVTMFEKKDAPPVLANIVYAHGTLDTSIDPEVLYDPYLADTIFRPGHLFQIFTHTDGINTSIIHGLFHVIRLPRMLKEGQIWDLRMLYEQGSITIAENATEPILLPDLPEYAHWDLSRYSSEGIVEAVIPPVCGDDKHPLQVGDFNRDCRVDDLDFAILSGQWGRTDCVEPDFCDGVDMDVDGLVGMEELARMAEQWLYCTAPECDG